MVRNLDTPCVAAPAMLQYRLAQQTAASVKAVIGGEGSDELFAGYPWFGGEWRWTLRRFVPRAALRAPAQRVTQIQWGRFLRMLAAEDDGAADREQYRLLTGLEQQRILGVGAPSRRRPRAAAARPAHRSVVPRRARAQAGARGHATDARWVC